MKKISLLLFLFLTVNFANSQSKLFTIKDSVNSKGESAILFFFPDATVETGMKLWEDHIEELSKEDPVIDGFFIQTPGVKFEEPLGGPFSSSTEFVQQRNGLDVFFVFKDTTQKIVSNPQDQRHLLIEKKLMHFVSNILVLQYEKRIDQEEEALEDLEDEVEDYRDKREDFYKDIEKIKIKIRNKEQERMVEKNTQNRLIGQIQSAKANIANANNKEAKKQYKKALSEFEDQLEDSQDEEKDITEDIFDLESEIRGIETEIELATSQENYYQGKADEVRALLLGLKEKLQEAERLKP